MAAPTIVRSPNLVDISAITEDASYLLISRGRTEDMAVRRMEFIGGNDADKIVIKHGADTGAVICQLGTPDAEKPDVRVWDPPRPMKPMIDFNLCTLNSGHRLIIEFE